MHASIPYFPNQSPRNGWKVSVAKQEALNVPCPQSGVMVLEHIRIRGQAREDKGKDGIQTKNGKENTVFTSIGFYSGRDRARRKESEWPP